MSGVELGPIARAVRDQRIPLEICPTSNTQTGIAEEIADHPFNLLYDMGFVCTINTDNRLVSGTTMTHEFEVLAEAFDLEYWQFLEFTTNALEVAFCTAALREDLERNIIYPAYAQLGEHFGAEDYDATGEDMDDAELTGGLSGGLGRLHGGHGHNHGHPGGELDGQEQMELSMENLKAELEQLGLSLDDDDDEDGTEDGTNGGAAGGPVGGTKQ